MPRNRRNKRGPFLGLLIITVAALIGLFMVNVDLAEADRNVIAPQAEASSLLTGSANDVGDSLASEVSGMSAVVKMLCALALVLVMMYGALRLLKKLMGRRHGASGGCQALEVMQTAAVGQNKSVALVKVGSRAVMVGITETQISILTELDSEETAALDDEVAETKSTEGFSDLLSKAVGKIRMPGSKSDPVAVKI